MSLIIPVGPGDHAEGPADAPVTLVEYGDFECSYCGEAYSVIKAVQAEMGDSLRFVFRSFPLTQIHRHAGQAAAMAEAAGAIGRFWPMHDMLFENQRHLHDDELIAYAARLGVGEADAKAALAGRFDAEIQAGFMGGVRSGVNGTPTLFINGERYDGPRSVAPLVAALGAAAMTAAGRHA